MKARWCTVVVVGVLIAGGCTVDAPLRNEPARLSSQLYGVRITPDTNLYQLDGATQQVVRDFLLDSLELTCRVQGLSRLGSWLWLECADRSGYFLQLQPLSVGTMISLPAATYFPVALDGATALMLSPKSATAFVVDYSGVIQTAPVVTDTIQLPAPPDQWVVQQGAMWIVVDRVLYQGHFPPFQLLAVDTFATHPLFLQYQPLQGRVWLAVPEADGKSARFGWIDEESGGVQWQFSLPLLPDPVLGAQLNAIDFLYLFTPTGIYRVDLLSPQRIVPVQQGPLDDFVLFPDGSFSVIIRGREYRKFDNRGQLVTSITLPFETQFFVEK